MGKDCWLNKRRIDMNMPEHMINTKVIKNLIKIFIFISSLSYCASYDAINYEFLCIFKDVVQIVRDSVLISIGTVYLSNRRCPDWLWGSVLIKTDNVCQTRLSNKLFHRFWLIIQNLYVVAKLKAVSSINLPSRFRLQFSSNL